MVGEVFVFNVLVK